MPDPLVTVVCLSYNHASYVVESLESVLTQTYEHIELIVVDDASTDNSVQIIRDFLKEHTEVSFIANTENEGNCKAFNKALELATGRYIIDLAADDILLPERVAAGVAAFQKWGSEYVLNFTNAIIVDAEGTPLKTHYPVNRQKQATISVPVGDVYESVISTYFICSPTMMVRTSELKRMGGYDESLAYEDFDLWVRMSRYYKFCYTDQLLVKKRVLSTSMSAQQYKHGSQQLFSTWSVCLKIKALNKTPEENTILKRRVLYELRRCLQVLEFALAFKYLRLWWSL